MRSPWQALLNWAAYGRKPSGRRSRSRSRTLPSHASHSASASSLLDTPPDPPLPCDPSAYALGDLLGRGASSAVYAAACSTHPGLALAVKRINLDDAASGGGDWDLVVREVRLASAIRSPHLVPLWAAFAAGAELWLVEPRAVCSVRDVLDRHCGGKGLGDGDAAAAVVKAVAAGLRALHAAGAAHRDVKASNVLLFEGEGGVLVPRLADLGAAGAAAGCGCLATSCAAAAATRSERGRALALGPSLWRLASSLGGRRRTSDGNGSGDGAPPPPPAAAVAAAAGPTASPPQPARHGIASPFGGGDGGAAADTPAPGKQPPPRGAASRDLPSYKTFAGSPAWMAPEVFNAATASTDTYSNSADVYSLACLVCELGHGAPPGAAAPFPVLAMSRLHGPPPDLHRPDWPKEAVALVCACGAREPGARPSAAGVLASPWLRGERVEVHGGRALAALVAGVPPEPTAQGGALAKPSLSETLLAPFRSRVGPPRAHPSPGPGAGGAAAAAATAAPACGLDSPPADADAGAAALMDAPAARRILRSALLPPAAAASGSAPPLLTPLLEAALPPGAPVPKAVAALASTTAVAVYGRDHCAGRALGRFRYRLGAAFLRVPVPAAGDAEADAAYEGNDPPDGSAWVGPILFFLGRRRNALPGGVHPPNSAPCDPTSDDTLVLALRAGTGARTLAALLGSTTTGGRRLGEVLGAPPRPSGTPLPGPGGFPRALWIKPHALDGGGWPAALPWTDMSTKAAGSAWLHAAADLTAAAHRAGGRGGGWWPGAARGGGRPAGPPVTVADVLSGRLPPPPAWQGFVDDLVAVRRFVEERGKQ